MHCICFQKEILKQFQNISGRKFVGAGVVGFVAGLF